MAAHGGGGTASAGDPARGGATAGAAAGDPARGGATAGAAAGATAPLARLLRPRSVAVVGATDRPGSYGDATVRNLAALGFPGPVWGVHPTRTEVHGRPCVARLDDLPGPVDAVVAAIPAAGVPDVARAARRLGCGSLVVFAAGFAEAGGAALQAELAEAAAGLPVLGPNCDGLVAFHARAALWGDALVPREPGRVALISQSGNVAVNALALGRGLRFHTVASIGNQAVLDAATLLEALVEEDGIGSVALFLESDGDGARLARALARAAEAGVGAAVLKVGATAAGASAAAAHTGALAGDQRVFRALVEEAGAAWADDVHDLLELAKALAVPRRRRPGGLAILTCSGGDSGLGADEAGRLGLTLPPLGAATVERLAPLLPPAATAANPLDYTAMIWGERARLAAIVRAVAADPAVGQLLLFYDEPPGMDAGLRASWDAVRDGLADGAEGADAPALVASTLPELLQDAAAAAFIARGIPAVAGLRTALACAAALRRAPGDPERLRAIAAAADEAGGAMRPAGVGERGAAGIATAGLEARDGGAAGIATAGIEERDGGAAGFATAGIEERGAGAAGFATAGIEERDAAVARRGRWLAEAEAKALLRDAGVAVPAGRVVGDEDGAVALARELGGAVAVKASSRVLQHKSDAGALALGVSGDEEVRAAYRRVAAAAAGADVLVEAMAPAGVELFVAVLRDAVVPALVVGLGGIWTELLDDVAIVPLPASPARVEAALRSLRGAGLLTGARGSSAVDVPAVAALAVRSSEIEGLTLLELNPVIASASGAIAVDAVARAHGVVCT